MHIYLIQDGKPIQETNEGLEYIGKIYLEDHMNCSALFALADQAICGIHPFEDVRLNSICVITLLEIFNENKHLVNSINFTSFKSIVAILQKAVDQRGGILSFCN
jgi:hypothetical protein